MTKFVRSFMFVLIAMSFVLTACGGACHHGSTSRC